MRLSSLLIASAGFFQSIDAASVFAHVVVGDTASHTQDTWANDIQLAAAAAIDAFALNIGYGDVNTPTQVANAFAAAESLQAAGGVGSDFKLFFSFDYLGGPDGAWPATGAFPDSVVSWLQEYVTSSVYFTFNGDYFVSTFEGIDNTADWEQGGAIRSAISGTIYFAPNWDSFGPGGISPYLDIIDGYFSWQAWPNGAVNMTDSIDKEWQAAIGSSKGYMMGVSPWFFHSASGGTDWVWRGDDLWADRWAETLDVQPQFVEIITWNDWGESTYIGPMPPSTAEIPAGSEVYVENMPHDSWRDFLPYYISAYKGDALTPTNDQMQYWYRLSPATGGSTCGVVGNNADQGQTETTPAAILEDGVFFSALLTSAATITVQIGSGPVESFAGAAGINHWSMPFNGQTGVPVFSVVRNGVTVDSSVDAAEITSETTLSDGCVNYNAWVGSWQS